ncbi:MAG TPA: DNA repair protein RecO [Candidatus Saccharimonadales bacterium]|nr:DNA repair protein RecO [Candidatus Saccharimonadales bacterium]
MATYKTSGIVLGRHNLGEADRIIVFFTPDRGKLRAVARGVRKPLSRQAGHVELFCQSNLMLAVGKNLDIVTSARLEHYPQQLTSDYDRLQLAFLMTRIVERLTSDHNAQPGLYQLLADSLNYLDQAGASQRLELFFKLQFLVQMGYRPQLDICSLCGGALEQAYLSPEHGGAVDSSCAGPEDFRVNANQLGLWRRICDSDLNALISSDEILAVETLGVCDTFYAYIFGRSFPAA